MDDIGSNSNERDVKELKAAALRYEAGTDRAPFVVAAGSGYMAQRILRTAMENGIAIYHDDSAATMLTKLQAGREIPPDLYQIVVNIYLALLDAAELKLTAGQAPKPDLPADDETLPDVVNGNEEA